MYPDVWAVGTFHNTMTLLTEDLCGLHAGQAIF